jgi:hypothetical protein
LFPEVGVPVDGVPVEGRPGKEGSLKAACALALEIKEASKREAAETWVFFICTSLF